MYHESAQGVDEGMINIHYYYYNLRQNEAQSARAESTDKGVNSRSKDVTQTQQQQKTRVAYDKYKVTNSPRGCPSGGVYVPYILYSLAR